MNDHHFFRQVINNLHAQGLNRFLQPVVQLPEGRIASGDKLFLNLSSNDYLGLSQQPELKEAAIEATRRWGVGAGASRLICGNHELYEQLEERIARFKGTAAAVVFASGYMANTGVISAIAAKGDCIFSDELNHASIIDGIRMSRGQLFVYRHNDMDHLEELLSLRPASGKAIVITDCVFSMDGDLAPLERLVAIRKKYGCLLIVDDAHATGVLGRSGGGLAEHLNIVGEIDATVGTFSKALGSLGGFVAGSNDLIDFLVNRARSLIFSTALPPSILAANIAAIDLTVNSPRLREKLFDNTHTLLYNLRKMGFQIGPTETPIIPLMVGETAKAVLLAAQLLKEGLLVKPIRPPTVPNGGARIRITASAAHSPEDMESALAAFIKVAEAVKSRQNVSLGAAL